MRRALGTRPVRQSGLFSRGVATALVLALLSGCAERDVILSGDRLALREGFRGAPEAPVNRALPLDLPRPVANADWTHRNGGPDHRLTHPALDADLTLAFATPIGEGNSRQARITADPVVLNGVIFTLDARARAQATAASGAVLWSVDLVPGSERPEDASGGGLATDGTRLYVTTGFGNLAALDLATGATLWTQDLDAPGGSAPTVSGGIVYTVSRDSRAWALQAESGRILWTIDAIPSVANFGGGAGAAIAGDTVVLPFPSGELIGAFAEGGLRRWGQMLAGERTGSANALAAGDISADPVIAGDVVYAGNVSGRVAALQLSTGERLWTATEGAVSPVWPVGDALFLVNDRSELMRLEAGTGAPVWRVPLSGFLEERPGRQRTRIAHYGPILAGGRLIVASGDGLLRSFDPVSGATTGSVALPGGAASAPVVAGGRLYVVAQDGQLLAFD